MGVDPQSEPGIGMAEALMLSPASSRTDGYVCRSMCMPFSRVPGIPVARIAGRHTAATLDC